VRATCCLELDFKLLELFCRLSGFDGEEEGTEDEDG